MASGIDLTSFPKLKVTGSNVIGSWKSWLSQFEISVEMTTLNLGKEDVDGQGTMLDKFRGRSKLLALLGAIGSEGMDILTSLGFDLKNGDADAYTAALDLLKGHYEREDSFYVKTMKFVTVSQAGGEDEREYLLRVEKLSRNMAFGAGNEELRKRFSVALAVNGLREHSIRRQLLQENDLQWDQLSAKLRTRQLGRVSDNILSEVKAGSFNVKTEISSVSEDEKKSVNQVYKSSKDKYRSRDSSRSSNSSRDSSSSRRYEGRSRRPYQSRDTRYRSRYNSPQRDEGCFQCGKSSHYVRHCPEVRCFQCQAKGHTIKDCPEGRGRSFRKYRHFQGTSNRDGSGSDSRSPSRKVRFHESNSK